MLRSELPRESDLAPPNAAGKHAKGKPLLAGYRRNVYSVPLVYMSVFMSVPYCFKSIVIYFEIRKCDASSSVPHALSCFCYLGSFVVP